MQKVDVLNDIVNEKDINENKNFENYLDNNFSEDNINTLFNKAEFSNPFNKYFSRGMFQCTRNYIYYTGKVHALMRDVYKTFYNCQKGTHQRGSEKIEKITSFDETLAKYKLDPKSISKINEERKSKNINE
uniref:Col_cuticle_N domain-containing protein n=1 Tax=Strongyloides stercoralis TaxID=6248 RepID=A0A0K0DU58_STRER